MAFTMILRKLDAMEAVDFDRRRREERRDEREVRRDERR